MSAPLRRAVPAGFGALAAGLCAALLAACAGQGPARSDIGLGRPTPNATADADSGVTEQQGPPRTRARAHTDLAAAYYQLGNMAVALDELRIAVAADPNYAPAYNVLGLVHADLHEDAEAAASFEKGLRLDAADPDTNHNYGWFLCRTGHEEQSVKYFLAAVRNPLYATPQKSYALAASCTLRKGNERDAQEYYERALRFDANYLPALIGYAQLKYRQGQVGDARLMVDRFNKITEPTSESLWLALRIAHNLGDRSSESAYGSQLRRQYAGSPEYQKLVKGQYD
jgi:type IV pilus assembly protein PilF